MLSRPFWLDENWVADGLAAPLGSLVHLTSSTPLGFTLLLRLVPYQSLPQLRLLPLAFAGLAVIPAWLLGREVQPENWITRLALGVAVALMPAMLFRQDLKQYTAEAFVVLVVAWLLARAQRTWGLRRLVTLGFATAVGLLLSDAALLMGTAAFAGLLAVSLLSRQWRRATEVLSVGAITLVFVAVIFETLVRPGDTPALRNFWQPYYIPIHHGVGPAVHFIQSRAAAELHILSVGPAPVASLLLVLGLAALVFRGLSALALALLFVVFEILGAAAAQQYPLWDTRTSTWFSTLATVIAVIGLTSGAETIWKQSRRRRWAKPIGITLALLMVVSVAIPFGRSARNAAAAEPWPPEDVAGQVATVLAHWEQGDVLLADSRTGYGLAITWPSAPQFLPAIDTAVTFHIGYPVADRVVVAADGTVTAERAAVAQAVALAQHESSARIWLLLQTDYDNFIGAIMSYGTLITVPDLRGSASVILLTLRSRSG
jgi:hypothetical protein